MEEELVAGGQHTGGETQPGKQPGVQLGIQTGGQPWIQGVQGVQGVHPGRHPAGRHPGTQGVHTGVQPVPVFSILAISTPIQIEFPDTLITSLSIGLLHEPLVDVFMLVPDPTFTFC